MPTDDKVHDPHYLNIRRFENLYTAWRHVRTKGQLSQNKEIQQEVAEFEPVAPKRLRRIARQLESGQFKFPSATGYLKKRKDKRPRPIVIACAESRIVQRTILEELLRIPAITNAIESPASFGGVRSRDVASAVSKAQFHLSSGLNCFLKSDIADFFTKIDQDEVAQRIRSLAEGDKFNKIIRQALEVHLRNEGDLRGALDLFPQDSTGVAQGGTLSSLAGNLYLMDFDRSMNQGDVVCIRYVDDLLLLGESQRMLLLAFKRCQRLLKQLGLTAYEPGVHGEKAELGEYQSGVPFLGYVLRPDLVSPSPKAREALLSRIDLILKTSASRIRSSRPSRNYKHSATQTLMLLHNTIKGWGNQYEISNDDEFFRKLDDELTSRIQRYLSSISAATRKARESPEASLLFRRRWGIQSLVDRKPFSKSSPTQNLKNSKNKKNS